MTTSSKNLHNIALKGVAETESTFFDKNPSGRIINRFSKDTAIADEPLLMYLVESINISFILLGIITIISIVSPVNLFGLILFLVLLFFSMKKIVPLTKMTRKLELISRSPLFTSINSLIYGLVTIRVLNLH